jgi:3'-phosphoadenosine 5'-phosphosulfate sulfotransferase (PAPS reductase)/FAD synthetase
MKLPPEITTVITGAVDQAICSELESESIEIIREVTATSTKPVMPYSIGKDSSAMLRLRRRCFTPAQSHSR